ncbi:M48 family metalloprotease [Sphingomonas sp. PB2P12]|uniref:M48 family metalloprotease n=1 Tax=Sphingomonas sandaracina TaxID=3096157 RepID=UPI002FCA02EF
MPGREADGRVEQIAFRLATAGAAHCPALEPDLGLVLQHLSQFELADRQGMIAQQSLDRGPGVIAVVPGGPAASAGMRPGDVLLEIDGRRIPPETALAAPFDATRAHARADAVRDLLSHTKDAPFAISLLRNGTVSTVTVTPRLACPSYVHLARSDQRNAYADGRHVFTTTGLVSTVRNDNELAFIIAHEMSHNILHHAVVMRGGAVTRGIGRTLGRSGRIVRETEREADALGGTLMLDAGFDPVRGAAILGRLGGGDLGIEIFAAHDSAGHRVAAMRALIEARRALVAARQPR